MAANSSMKSLPVSVQEPLRPEAILYRDDDLAVVSKPTGMLVHRGMGAQDDERFLLQEVRDLLGARVFPVHRLDRPTAGLVVFALHSDGARYLQEQWKEGKVRKAYRAIVRGFMPSAEGLHDEALEDPDSGVWQDAQTRWNVQDTCQIPLAIGNFATARYTLLDLEPLTGRFHQLRRHLAHLGHPIVGDTTHGDRHHNHAWQAHFGWWRLMLWAYKLEIIHPSSAKSMAFCDTPENGIEAYWARLLASDCGRTQLRPDAFAS